MRTAEQVAADEALTAAIERCAAAYEIIATGELLFEYGVVFHYKSLELVETDRSGYGAVWREGNVPTHVAVGLLEVAKSNVMDGFE